MIHPDDQQLVTQCFELKQNLDAALAWTAAHLPPEKQYRLRDNLRRYYRSADRFQRVAALRPSAAIFGLSQVGKSYLVSNLVRKPGETELTIVNPGYAETELPRILKRPGAEKIDFIRDINPPGGGKESTGCVTRFTAQKMSQATGRKPFLIRLFSQSEIVKIITNSYLGDLRDYQLVIDAERDNITKRFQELNAQKAPQAFPGFSENDVYDLRDYLEATFNDHPNIRDLAKFRYWDDAAELIPFLPPAERWRILEFLWGKQPFFNDFFEKLTQGLAALHFADEIRVDLQALAPNTQTLIDIERVREIFPSYCEAQKQKNPLWEKPAPIELTTKDGKDLQMDRSIIAALAHEIILHIPTDTAEMPFRHFLKETDVLDFPGARSRKKIEERTFTNEPEIQSQVELFIRGKVAYLFDIYQQSFEISSLVFCMDNGQPNVEDIQKLIREWISNSHGSSAEERERRENRLKSLVPEGSDIERLIPLLFICTKFNLDLNPNQATDRANDPTSYDGKWVSRLEANFAQYMSLPIQDKWTLDWNLSEGSFKNAFLLRDPSYPGGVYKDYDSGDEKYADGQSQRIEDIRQSFIQHPAVRQHFRQPEIAWQEAATPGKNGGVDYIIRHLVPVCHPAIKRHHISQALRQLTEEAARDLCTHFEGGDAAEKLIKANLKGAKVWGKMIRLREHFGHFLDSLTLSEDVAWKLYYDLMNVSYRQIQTPDTAAAENSHKKQQVAIMEDAIKNLLGVDDISNLSKKQVRQKLADRFRIQPEQVEASLDLNLDEIFQTTEQIRVADRYAEQLLGEWIRRAGRLKHQEQLPQWGLSENEADIVAEELVKNLDRVNLKKIIADTVDAQVKNFNTSQNYDIVARLATLKLNEFVNTLGWSFVPETEKMEAEIKIAKTDSLPIFTARPVPTISKQEIRQKPTLANAQRHNEWTAGLQKSFEYNVLSENNLKNIERAMAMQQLGQIIERLDFKCP